MMGYFFFHFPHISVKVRQKKKVFIGITEKICTETNLIAVLEKGPK